MNAPIRIKDPNSSKQYSFNLTFGGMAVLLSALTLALTLFFILGVLVGRGHRPETAVPVVADMMPREPMSRAVPSPEVLKAEDLNYGEQLGKRNDVPAPARAMDKNEHKAQEKKTEKAEVKKETKKDARTEAKPETKTDAKKDAKKDDQKAEKLADKKAADKKPDPDTQRYDYAYQAATFPDADSAKTFLKRVKGMGLKGDIETGATNGKNWHRVVVFFQGTPTDTRALKEKLGTLGAQKLVMRSKTPI